MQIGVVLTGVISWATTCTPSGSTYDVLQPQRLNRARMVPLLVLVLALVVGMLRAVGSTSPWSWSTAAGAVTGFAAAAGVLSLVRQRTRRATLRAELAD